MTPNDLFFARTIQELKESGNFRSIPEDYSNVLLDLSSNDYLGLAQDKQFRHYLLQYALEKDLLLGSSASRLLAANQTEYNQLEDLLSKLYPGRRALLFNSGYHANTGIISAIADRSTLILADRLVHASIIDGIVLSRASFMRFRHNDYDHLIQLLEDKGKDYQRILIVAESVYSMDGDKADIEALANIKTSFPNAMIYIDEAHAIGVEGPSGLGCAMQSGRLNEIDVVVGTFGKALATEGAFAIVSPLLRDFLVNKSRSLIFSTVIPPVIAAWTRLSMLKMLEMDQERNHLRKLASELGEILGNKSNSHIQPYIVGNPVEAIGLSKRLMECGVKALPIRTPTVPPGTERLRFSLSAAIKDLSPLKNAWK